MQVLTLRSNWQSLCSWLFIYQVSIWVSKLHMTDVIVEVGWVEDLFWMEPKSGKPFSDKVLILRADFTFSTMSKQAKKKGWQENPHLLTCWVLSQPRWNCKKIPVDKKQKAWKGLTRQIKILKDILSVLTQSSSIMSFDWICQRHNENLKSSHGLFGGKS